MRHDNATLARFYVRRPCSGPRKYTFVTDAGNRLQSPLQPILDNAVGCNDQLRCPSIHTRSVEAKFSGIESRLAQPMLSVYPTAVFSVTVPADTIGRPESQPVSSRTVMVSCTIATDNEP